MEQVLFPVPRIKGKTGGFDYAFGVCANCGSEIRLSRYWAAFEVLKHKNTKGVAQFFHPWADKPLCGPVCALNYHKNPFKESK